MVLHLLGGQTGDRRQDAKRVSGKENDLRRMACAGHRLDDIVDMRQRIGDAGILGFAAVGIIHAAVGAHHHVFQQRIAADGAINLRLRLRVEINGLGVAAAFEVKYPVIVPAVLVIANQLTMRVGGQRGFAGTGEAEEQRDVPCFATVGRAVHRRDAFLRQQVVHDREHPFFHFAAVPGAADELNTLAQVKGDEVLGVHALRLPVGIGAAGAVEHHEIWRKAGQLVGARHDKHVFDKVGLPRHLGNEAHAKAGVRAGAAPGVDDVQFFAAQLACDQAFQAAPHVWR
ncbi:hypothetical protein SB00610_05425 [Klebsiella quasipneumoniae subsp. similipneumoniae]|nr:hypothetical protein SB00610_05425 [Klebsiella quasipneumoniae subsp. similipneumoniae]